MAHPARAAACPNRNTTIAVPPADDGEAPGRPSVAAALTGIKPICAGGRPGGRRACPRAGPGAALNRPGMPSYRRHGHSPEAAAARIDRGMPQGTPMSDHLHVVCPHCDTTNRVLRDRLDAGAKLRQLQAGAALRASARAYRDEFRSPHRRERSAGGRRFLGAVVRTVPDDGAGVRAGRRAACAGRAARQAQYRERARRSPRASASAAFRR